MKTIYKTLLTTCLLAVVGCSDDFLDTSPEDSISKENFFNSESDLQLYMNGLQSTPGYWLFLSDQGTDDLATTGTVEIQNMVTGSPSAENITGGWTWGRLRDVNYFLESYDKADVDDITKQHFEGLGRYFRAEFYYGKVKRFSDVPWYSSTLGTEDEELYKPRDPRTMVVDSLMADLQFAADHIREETPTGTVDKWAALFLQARIALHEGTFRKYHSELGLESSANTYLEIAKNAALALMNSGNFAIYNTGNPGSDYGSLFNSEDLSSNPEAVLINIYDASKDKNSGDYTVFGNYEQSPTKDLLNTYLMADGSRFTDQAGWDTFTYVEEFENRDPRMAQTFVGPGWIQAGSSTPYILELNKNFTGYHQQKGLNNTTVAAGIDIAIYRYAEVLLTYAEALAEMGSLTQADLDNSVNLLRQRAGLPNLDMAMANANIDPILENRYPNVSGANKGIILEIRRERRVELAVEARRFDDLNRWAVGKIFENIPQGAYFPGLGKYDMTGDGIEDIHIIDSSDEVPSPKEQNSLGVDLIYYKAGFFGDERANLFLSNGTSGNMVTATSQRTFVEPKYYYRPIPAHQVVLNPQLKQIMGW